MLQKSLFYSMGFGKLSVLSGHQMTTDAKDNRKYVKGGGKMEREVRRPCEWVREKGQIGKLGDHRTNRKIMIA